MKLVAWSLLLTVLGAALFYILYVSAGAVLPVLKHDLSLAVAAAITQPLFLLGINAWIKWMER